MRIYNVSKEFPYRSNENRKRSSIKIEIERNG